MADIKQKVTFQVEGAEDLLRAADALTQLGRNARRLGKIDIKSSGLEGASSAAEKATRSTREMGQQAQQTGMSVSSMTNSLSNARYALYDMVATLTEIGGAANRFRESINTAAKDYEAAFAQVIRTNGLSSESAKQMSAELMKMSTTMPVSYTALSNTAALAGQLGIAKDSVTSFTRTVSMMASTTDLTLDSASTTLARFQAVMGTTGADFDNLGSSILKVGVNSAATEQQIASISVQLSSMGKMAGLTDYQVVGLSGALASIGVAPELSRGVITRAFTKIQSAVQEGGESLNLFARVSGRTSEEVKQAWGTDRFAGVFLDFMKGLQREGDNAVNVLNAMGIKASRDVPTLLRLAEANRVLEQSMSDAESGYASSSTLTSQYGQIMQTTAAKAEMFKNSLENLKATVGQSTNSAYKKLYDIGTYVVNIMTDLAGSKIGNIFGVLLNGFSIGITILTAYYTKIAATVAATYALRTAQLQFTGSAITPVNGIRTLASALTALNREMNQSVATSSASASALTRHAAASRTAAASAAAAARTQSAANTAQGSAGMAAGVGGVAAMGTAAKSTSSSMLGMVGSFLKATAAAAGLGVIMHGLGALAEQSNQKRQAEAEKTQRVAEAHNQLAQAVREDTKTYNETGKAAQLYVRAVNEAGVTASSHVFAAGDSAAQTRAMAQAQQELQAKTKGATGEIQYQIMAIGDQTKKMQASLVTKGVSRLSNNPVLGPDLQKAGFSVDEYTRKLQQGSEAATRYIDGIRNKLRELNQERYGDNWIPFAIQDKQLKEVNDELTRSLSDYRNEADIASQVNKTLGVTSSEAADGMSDVGDSASDASNKLKDLVDSALGGQEAILGMADSMAALGESVAKNGTSLDVMTEAGRNNLSALYRVVHDAVEASGGDANLLSQYLSQISETLKAYGIDASGVLGMLQQQLVNTANTSGAASNAVVGNVTNAVISLQSLANAIAAIGVQIASIAGIGKQVAASTAGAVGGLGGGANTNALGASLTGLTKKVTPLTGAFNGLGKVFRGGYAKGVQEAAKSSSRAAKSANNAAKGARNAAKGIKDSGKAASQAAKEIRTYSDYISDIQSASSKAFEIRWDHIKAADSTHKAFDSLVDYFKNAQKEASDAQKEIKDLNKSLAGSVIKIQELDAEFTKLSSEKDKLTFQLSVATEYKDDLRANEIRGELAENAAKQTKNRQDRTDTLDDRAEQSDKLTEAYNKLFDAQRKMVRDATSYNAMAREQRGLILDMVDAYQKQIIAYANTGASTQQVLNYTAALRNEFVRNLQTMGFSTQEVYRYSASFGDLSKIVAGVPKNVTVAVSTDPAQRALDELKAKSDKSSSSLGGLGDAANGAGSDLGGLGNAAGGGGGGAAGGLGALGDAAEDAQDDLAKLVGSGINAVAYALSSMAAPSLENMGRQLGSVAGSAWYAQGQMGRLGYGMGSFASSAYHATSTVRTTSYMLNNAAGSANNLDWAVNSISYYGLYGLGSAASSAEYRLRSAASAAASLAIQAASIGGFGRSFYFSSGGVVPNNSGRLAFVPSGTDTVPAMLTPGEFVINKSTVDRYGVAFFENLQRGVGQASTSIAMRAQATTGGRNVVELSPIDRELLRRAGVAPTLMLDGKVVSDAVGSRSSIASRRGA